MGKKAFITIVVLLVFYSTVVGIVYLIRTKDKMKIIMSPTNKYEVVFKKGAYGDEFLNLMSIKQKEIQQIVLGLPYGEPIGGEILNVHWSPKEDFLVVETIQKRIEVFDILNGKRVPIHLDYNRQPEITHVEFREWTDQGLRFGVKRADSKTTLFELDRNGKVTLYGIVIP